MPRKNIKRGRNDKNTTRSTRILISYPRISVEHESKNSSIHIATNELTIFEFKGGNNGEVKTFLEAGNIKYELLRGVTSYSRLEKVFILSNNRGGTRLKIVFPHGIPDEYCDNFYGELQATLESSEHSTQNTAQSPEIEVIDISSRFHATGGFQTNESTVTRNTAQSSEIEVIDRSSRFHATGGLQTNEATVTQNTAQSSEIEVIDRSSRFHATGGFQTNESTVTRNTAQSPEIEVIDRSSRFHATGGFQTNESTIFDFLVQGSEFLAQGLVSGAERVGKMIDRGTPALIDTIIPEEKPTEVDPAIQVGLNVAKGITQGIAVTSQIRTSSTAAVAAGIGQFLAPHIKKIGTEVLTSDYGYSAGDAEVKVERALEVTAGVATGIATLFDGFMSACSILGDSISRNAVEVVKHKYGDAAADATNDALGIVANVTSTRMSEKRRQKKGIAIQAASGIYPVND